MAVLRPRMKESAVRPVSDCKYIVSYFVINLKTKADEISTLN